MFHTRGTILKIFGIIPSFVVVTHGDIPRLVALVLGANKLLVMVKDTGSLCFIAIGKAFLQFINSSIILQL
jgi:hypothetical protein